MPGTIQRQIRSVVSLTFPQSINRWPVALPTIRYFRCDHVVHFTTVRIQSRRYTTTPPPRHANGSSRFHVATPLARQKYTARDILIQFLANQLQKGPI